VTFSEWMGVCEGALGVEENSVNFSA